jgi:hypothetical protein
MTNVLWSVTVLVVFLVGYVLGYVAACHNKQAEDDDKLCPHGVEWDECPVCNH